MLRFTEVTADMMDELNILDNVGLVFELLDSNVVINNSKFNDNNFDFYSVNNVLNQGSKIVINY